MWGKAVIAKGDRVEIRITPTHVGKSVCVFVHFVVREDHPHPCGEKCSYKQFLSVRTGSPPPMWGKVQTRSAISTLTGITPTHVGKRLFIRSFNCFAKDHPHPCGEKLKFKQFHLCLLGSPPPMWGKVREVYRTYSALRITPTHVGKRVVGVTPIIFAKDHPHPCGEKFD